MWRIPVQAAQMFSVLIGYLETLAVELPPWRVANTQQLNTAKIKHPLQQVTKREHLY